MFIYDKDAAIRVLAAQQDRGVMSEAVVQGGKPFHAAPIVKIGDDMDVAAEGREELAGGDVPIPIEPGAASPAGRGFGGFSGIRGC